MTPTSITEFNIKDLPSLPTAHSSRSSRLSGVVKDIQGSVSTTWTHWDGSWSSDVQIRGENRGLCVFIHGLMGHPRQFSHQRLLLEENMADISILHPLVLKKGNCSVEEAALPLFKEIQKWCALPENRKKPVSFAATSNGSRIATNIIGKLKQDYSSHPLQLSSIAGVFEGTYLIGTPNPPTTVWGKVWGLGLQTLFSPDIQEELALNSACSQTLLKILRSPETAPDSIILYGTASDTKVIPFTSSFPDIKGARNYLVENEGHSSIVSAVAKHQIEGVSSFLQEHVDDI